MMSPRADLWRDELCQKEGYEQDPGDRVRGRMCEVGLARLRAQGGSAEGAAGLHPDVLDLA